MKLSAAYLSSIRIRKVSSSEISSSQSLSSSNLKVSNNSDGYRPSDKGRGGGGGGGHPDPEMRGEAVSKKFFRPLRPQFSLKRRGRPSYGSSTEEGSCYRINSLYPTWLKEGAQIRRRAHNRGGVYKVNFLSTKCNSILAKSLKEALSQY